MKYLKTLAAVALAAAGVLAIVDVLGVAGASPPSIESAEAGTLIKASLIPGTHSTLTTLYGNVECAKSTIDAEVTGTEKEVRAKIETLEFEECNCEVKVLGKGTIGIQRSNDTESASVKSTGAEITSLCPTVGGDVHCIYATQGTDLGTLVAGDPAKIKISNAPLPPFATDPRCEGGAKWESEYEVRRS